MSARQWRSISERRESTARETPKTRCLSMTASYRPMDDDMELGVARAASTQSAGSPVERTYACPGDREKRAAARTLVLYIDEHGDVSFREMSHFDVLRMTHEAAIEPTVIIQEEQAAAPVGDANMDDGSAQLHDTSRDRTSFEAALRRGSRRTPDPRGYDYGNIVDVQCVHARDIRRLSNTFASSNEPSIIVRKQAILMNADPLRAIVMRNACLIFVPDGADSLVLYLKKNCSEFIASGFGSDVPFEFRAIEALLATMSQCFMTDYEKLSIAVASALDRLARGRLAVEDLETMRVLKNDMNEFEAQIDGVRRTLVELLDNEEDLRLLYLSKLYATPSLLTDLFSFDSEESEVLLENYLQDIVSTRRRAMLLQNRIQTTESLLAMKLDTTRNYLLGVDVIFSLVAIGISVGTFVTGAFGMNLNSHLQETEGVFWGVITFSIVFFVVATVVGTVFFRMKGVFI